MKGQQRFKDKIVLVTGGASGIGKATALMFAKEGAHVVVADVTETNQEKVLAELLALSPKSIFVKCDVSQSSEVARLFKTMLQQFGRIDCAFNNAGIEGKTSTVVDMAEEQWDRLIDTNLKSVWMCMKHELEQMLKQGGGAIVNCASVAGLVGFAGLGAYTASKHGIVGLTKTAALENARNNIRINAVCPGVIDTPMVSRLVQGNKPMQAALEASEPIGRFGKPEEIADAVLWLCSEGATFMMGQAIAVDGGWVAQ